MAMRLSTCVLQSADLLEDSRCARFILERAESQIASVLPDYLRDLYRLIVLLQGPGRGRGRRDIKAPACKMAANALAISSRRGSVLGAGDLAAALILQCMQCAVMCQGWQVLMWQLQSRAMHWQKEYCKAAAQLERI